MTAVSAPKDKLDASVGAGVNGPEGGLLAGWDRADWDRAQQNVRRLCLRIFTASRDGVLAKVRTLHD
jgi:RNA-directed DNA polymerase